MMTTSPQAEWVAVAIDRADGSPLFSDGHILLRWEREADAKAFAFDRVKDNPEVDYVVYALSHSNLPYYTPSEA